jgi:hypothetical protein
MACLSVQPAHAKAYVSAVQSLLEARHINPGSIEALNHKGMFKKL